MCFWTKKPKLDMWAASYAFAVGYPGMVKLCTIGEGIVFHTELLINGKLWLYEAFPKTISNIYPEGYEHVWNGLVLQNDIISADCTVPWRHRGASWSPPIPRCERYYKLDALPNKTKTVEVTDTQFDLGNNFISTSKFQCYGTIYIPYMFNLGGNIGLRWIVDVGFMDGPERWSVDLGEEEGKFSPKYGIVGYHEATDWNKKRYFGDIQEKSINMERRFNGMPQV